MSRQGNNNVPAVASVEAPVRTMKMRGPATSTGTEQVAEESSSRYGAAESTHL